MNTIKQKLEELISTKIKDLYNIDCEVNLTTPPKKEMGDYAFWVFLIAKELKKSPLEICNELKEWLSNNQNLSSVEIAWPFLNIRLSFNFYTNIFLESDFSKIPNIWNWKNIVVDYIWTNVWKVLHIWHMCTPNNWQVFVNLFKKLWYNVIWDSHLWDWGIIFWKLILAYKMWWDENELKNDTVEYLHKLYIKITSESEVDETIEEKTRNEFKLLSEWNPESVELWKNFTRYSIDAMQTQLDRLWVKAQYDIWESFYEGLWLPKMWNFPDLTYNMKDIVKELIEKWIATQNDDWSVWVIFEESTKIPSCILQKRDWTHGYLASDLAWVKYRMQNWNPEKIIYFVDQRQQLHLKQVFEISKKAWWLDKKDSSTQLFHAYNWFVSLKDWAMSSRKWNIIKLWDLLDEAESRASKIILEKREDISKDELNELSKIIWIWAIKYWYLSKSRTTDLVFDWDEFMTFEWNSAPFVSYSYVRALNILKNSNIDLETIKNHKTWLLNNQAEIDLLIDLSDFNTILQESANNYFSHNLVNYAYNLTKKFNWYYSKVNIINTTDLDDKILKLKLVLTFKNIIEEIFDIVAIKLPKKM